MQTTPLETRIAKLRGQVRSLVALHGTSWTIGLIIPIVILIGLADWGIHLDSPVRLLALLALIGFLAWLTFRYIVIPLYVPFADLDIALRIEERWPGLNDRLASTLQFLKVSPENDDHSSRSLREETIRQTMEEVKTLDFREVIEPKPAFKALGLASGSLIVALTFILAQPLLSSIALKRLFLPYGSAQWPQRTHLSLIDSETPRKVAQGEPFTLSVAVRKGERAPATARVTYRFDDGETTTEPLRAVAGGIFQGRLESVERAFSFSVSAGDDTRSIRDIAVAVVPPPVLKDVTIQLVPPAYTAEPPQRLAPGNTLVRALEGSRIDVTATANKPIETASLHLGESVSKEAIRFNPARTHLAIQFVAGTSGPFWFELRDTEGFKNREVTRFDLRSMRDEAPRVVIDDPSNDRDVPPQAKVPVTFTVDDDFGIQSASLLYKAAAGGSEATQVVALPLWDSKDHPDAQRIKHQTVRYDWELGPLKLPPGSIITFHAEARDFDNLKGPNLGKSREIRLRIVSDEDIARQLDDTRREIREETARILAMQNMAQTPVDEALRLLSKTDNVGKAERENLKNAEMIQRQVGNRVTSRTDGLDQKIRRFLDDLRNFRVPNPDAQKQMEEMRAGVDRIRENHLGPAEQGLTHASKNLDEAESAKGASPSAPPNPQGEAAKAQSKPSAESAKGTQKSGDNAKASGKKANSPSNNMKGAGESSKNGESGRDEKGGDQTPQAKDGDPEGSKRDYTEIARKALQESKASQKGIADELQKMLDGLSEFETYRGVVKDAQNLLKEHEQVMKQTAETSAKPALAGKTPEQLSPEQKGELGNLASRQNNIARGLQGLQERMAEMGKRLEDSDPLASSALKETADQSRKKGTSGKIGDASDRLEKNQMGEAKAQQEQARRDLKDLIDSIQNRRERELARLVKELKNAEEELAKLRNRQTENLKKTQEAKKNPNAKERADQLKKLAKEQAEIQNELKRQLQRLKKLNADNAAQAGDRAAARMSKAQENLDQDQGEQAGQEEQEALADLQDAEDEVRKARREREEQLAMEQLSKMGDQLKSLSERQAKMSTDIASFEKLRADKQGKLTIAQRTGVRDLGQVQAGLKDETGELIEKLEGAPVFGLTLKRAAEGMQTAAQRLQALKTDEETQRAARAASHRFEQLINSLKPDAPKQGGQKGDQNGDQDGGGGSQGGGDGIPATAQLKMLKALQEEINERTDYFDELRRRNRPLDPSQTAELDKLQTDQGTLADLVRDLTKPKKEDGED